MKVCRSIRLPEDLFDAHGAIWLRVLAYMILNRRERLLWRELNAASSKRRRDWLMGRIAAKDAVRLLIKDQVGLVLCPADIEITSAATGQPEVNWQLAASRRVSRRSYRSRIRAMWPWRSYRPTKMCMASGSILNRSIELAQILSEWLLLHTSSDCWIRSIKTNAASGPRACGARKKPSAKRSGVD